MALRRGIYIVPTNKWYIERTVWLVAGIVLLDEHVARVVGQPVFRAVHHRDGTRLDRRQPHRLLHRRERAAQAGLPAPARHRRLRAREVLLHEDGRLVPRAPDLRGGGIQHLARLGALDRLQSVVAGVHRASSGSPWSGSPRRATASWRTGCTGSAPSRGWRRSKGATGRTPAARHPSARRGPERRVRAPECGDSGVSSSGSASRSAASSDWHAHTSALHRARLARRRSESRSSPSRARSA